ncbi:uncharacterized protein M421DRAFT_426797 [Didymella exigua CBS 183.55]|uniref:Uncharacterized protein n=1 Tax=Didymella exigua CBS 183.55 TaxID=1150837 RepID=A0A6A5R5T7_9PLEO|nr:uncharacterized protein M421DRAFT_426797 [Didymella exigua CBS 183.55]KAF1922560.1 hypothetical protein M421DRAFT_426797 [Didymella exigua CBS 183.55]
MDVSIAGYLLEAVGGSKQGKGVGQSIEVYRPSILHASGVATLSALFIILAILTVTKKVLKRV